MRLRLLRHLDRIRDRRPVLRISRSSYRRRRRRSLLALAIVLLALSAGLLLADSLTAKARGYLRPPVQSTGEVPASP